MKFSVKKKKMFMNHNKCILELCGLRDHLQGMEKRITKYRSSEKNKAYESNLHLNFDMQKYFGSKTSHSVRTTFNII